MGNQAGIIIRNVKNELFHSAKRLILNEVKGIECLPSTEKSMKTPLDSVLFEVSSKCREIIAYINKWSKGNKLRGMSFKELDRLSDSLFDYEDELDEYEGKLTSLTVATPQGFAARQEDIDSLMTVVGRVRHTIINMQEAVDKTIEITTSDDEEEFFDPDDKAQLEKLFNYLTTIGWDGQPKEWFLSVRLWDFDFARLITLTPLDCPEALDAIDDLRDASLAMMRDIQRSDAKQPKLLMNELFGV